MKPRPRTVCIVTGSRAEFGLLRPVMLAVQNHKQLKLQVVAAGAHLLPPARTIREVESEFHLAATVPMQRPRESGRIADAAAAGRGISGFARAFADLKPDWVVVLGDRIEAFAAAAAASIGGIAVAHIHGGDRAEGIADEALRHAITKLSHLHCAASAQSARRIARMGENPASIHMTGSPAIDCLRGIKAMSDRDARQLGDPQAVLLLHPSGLGDDGDAHLASGITLAIAAAGPERVLTLAPNHDAGRDAIARILARDARLFGGPMIDHLPRATFVSLLKRLRTRGGMLIGNSSAGLIECAALGVTAINIGPRQDGRERRDNVIHVPLDTGQLVVDRVIAAFRVGRRRRSRPDQGFGDGRTGPRIASLLARVDPQAREFTRKHNMY